MKRFERIGTRSCTARRRHDGRRPDAGVVSTTRRKRRLVAGLLGQAYVVAYNTIRHNREGTAHVADVLVGQARDLRRRRRRAARRGRPAQAGDRRARRGRMAGDLIPPPSPAGRPEPESSEQAAARRAGLLWAEPRPRSRTARRPAAAESRPWSRRARSGAGRRRPIRPRFGFVLGALIGVAIAGDRAVAAVRAADDSRARRLVGLDHADAATTPDGGQGDRRARRAQVPPRRRQPARGRAVGALEVDATCRSTRAALAPPAAATSSSSRATASCTRSTGWAARLDPDGEPSAERHLLLRREALELALYTFHYADGRRHGRRAAAAPAAGGGQGAKTDAGHGRPGPADAARCSPTATIPPADPEGGELDGPTLRRSGTRSRHERLPHRRPDAKTY